jgi:hypothetical protein
MKRKRFGWKAGVPHPLMKEAVGGWQRVLHASLGDPESVIEDARCYFLSRIRERRIAVLEELAACLDIPEDLAAWAEAWHLIERSPKGHNWHGLLLRHDPWVLDHALDTLALWQHWPNGRGREWSYNRAAASGRLVPDRGRLPAFKHRDVSEPWFDWLVDAQVAKTRPTLTAVAAEHSVDQRAVARGCRELAAFLAMPSPSVTRSAKRAAAKLAR